MIDLWRRFHPDSNQFTYRGYQDWTEYIFQKTDSTKHIPLRYAPGSQMMQDCPQYTISHKETRPVFRGFRNTLLNDKFFIKHKENITFFTF
jgi:hypothetical protein